MASEEDKVWLEQLRGWDADGTLKVIRAVQRSRGSVRVRRSDLSYNEGVIHGLEHAGRTVIVRFAIGDEIAMRMVRTEDFIEQNQELFTWTKGDEHE